MSLYYQQVTTIVILYEFEYEKELIQHQDNNPSNNDNEDNKIELNTPDNKKTTTSVLCPSYKINRSKDGYIECLASFRPTACNKTVNIYLEVWIKENRLLQSPSKQTFVDCNPANEIFNR